ncbi:PaaX family transcriptional regulator [Geodermatophilus sabuli]|uniref:Transcriptional regulator, PaaX family n=1 Tax=Geodermatophilus sabuli TaxID=1564158 RepID=A0A285EF27_9ACTN|nr:PaaX family transcriptional regulator C-terminal domain-containing protein [Geodermatophilus sabuli]MBB3086183.1 phenylacetic acid degradation operon negative regulatory protein [Geodermatophilus sabuli]SNX97600.1 transcriptional regulator, PaaX family [Geodermatophilus sabuli]
MTVRDLVVDLFSHHIDAVTDEPVRLQALVALLEHFHVAEPTSRMTMATLRRYGWLAASRRGRETLYTPTEVLRSSVRTRWTRLDERLGPWDGRWRMVIYTVPETDRSARERVRRTLARHGFGPLAPATWLSPHRVALDDVRIELAGEPISRLDLLTAQVTEETGCSDTDLAARCWDLQGVAAAYRQEIARLRAVLAGPTPDGPQALVTHLRALASVRRTSTADPVLPDALRPAGWPGAEMREAWSEVCERLLGPAREHVAAVLARPEPAQRCTEDMSG